MESRPSRSSVQRAIGPKSSRSGSRDGSDLQATLFDFDAGLRRCAHQHTITDVDVKHVWRGIVFAEHPIDVEGGRTAIHGQSARQHTLKNVARVDVLEKLPDRFHEIFVGNIRHDTLLRTGRDTWPCLYGAESTVFQRSNISLVSLVGFRFVICLQETSDDTDLAKQVIEDHRVECKDEINIGLLKDVGTATR